MVFIAHRPNEELAIIRRDEELNEIQSDKAQRRRDVRQVRADEGLATLVVEVMRWLWVADVDCLHEDAVAPRQLSSSSASSASSSSTESDIEGVISSCKSEYDDLSWILVNKTLHRCIYKQVGDASLPRPSCCDIRREAVVGQGLSAAAFRAEPRNAQWCGRCAQDIRTFCRAAGLFDFWI